MKTIEVIRALVRPFIAVSMIGAVVYLAIALAQKFADADMGMLIVTFILATGGTVTGFYFGERAARKDTKP